MSFSVHVFCSLCKRIYKQQIHWTDDFSIPVYCKCVVKHLSTRLYAVIDAPILHLEKKPSVNNYMHLLYVILWFTVGEKPFLQLWYSMYRLTCICKALHIKSILHNQVSIFVCFIFCVLIACILVRMYKINSISCLTMYLFRTSEFTKSSQSLWSQAFVCFPIHTV